MKFLKMAGLMALAATALMAFASTAFGTTITSPTGTTYTSTITANNENGHVVLKGSFGVEVKCDSHVKGKITAHGTGVNASGPIEELSFTGCTEGYEATVLNKGTLSINSAQEVFGHNNEVTVHTPLSINCTYKTAAAGTKLGTLTDSHDRGGATATLHVNATIPRTGHSFLCGATGAWVGSYLVSTPDTLYVD